MKCSSCGCEPLNFWKSQGLFYCRPCYMAGCKAPAVASRPVGPCAVPSVRAWTRPAIVKAPFYFHASCLGDAVYAGCPDEFTAQVAVTWGKMAANVSCARFSANAPKPTATHCPEIPGAAMRWLRKVLAGEILPDDFCGRHGNANKAAFLIDWAPRLAAYDGQALAVAA